VEVEACLKPALKYVHETRIKRRRKHRVIGFSIQIGLEIYYVCGSRKVKKLSSRRSLMPRKPHDYGSSVVL
jgi:hypothetical protein